MLRAPIEGDDIVSLLKRAAHNMELVNIGRHAIEDTETYSEGYAVSLSDECFLLHRISDRFDLDGYEILRTRDITSAVTEFARKDLLLKAAAAKAMTPKAPNGIDVSDMSAVLRSVCDNYPVIVIERERIHLDECEIGRIEHVTSADYTFRLLSPMGIWSRNVVSEKIADVTRVTFDGEYENTLATISVPGV